MWPLDGAGAGEGAWKCGWEMSSRDSKRLERGRDTHLLVVIHRVSTSGTRSSRAWGAAHSRAYQAAIHKWGRQRSTCRDISKSRARLRISVSAGRETSSRVQGFRLFGGLAETLWRLSALPDIYTCWRRGRQGVGAERKYSVCAVPETVAYPGLDKSRRGRGGEADAWRCQADGLSVRSLGQWRGAGRGSEDFSRGKR